MKIHLKRNNRPKKPGIYLCQRINDGRPTLAEIRNESDSLWMLHEIGIFPLNQYDKESLWSDRIEIEFP